MADRTRAIYAALAGNAAIAATAGQGAAIRLWPGAVFLDLRAPQMWAHRIGDRMGRPDAMA